METMRGFLAFGICFAILAMIWNHHYVYSRASASTTVSCGF
jgi:uncharacterized membrane protein